MNTTTNNGTKPAAPPAPAKKSVLERVQAGRIEMPVRALISGSEGVGKSTFAAGAPSPIFLTGDNGTSLLDVVRLPVPRTWGDVLEAVDALALEEHPYKTFVADPVNWLESLVYDQVCKDNGWKDIEAPGYGKGYAAALDQWRVLVARVERLWSEKKMHVLFVAHCAIRSFKNPEGEDYDRYTLAMHEKAAGLLRQWCDAVLFARHEAFAKTDQKTKRVRGVSSGARVIHTQWTAAYDAKNRYNLPEELPLSWEAFFGAVKANGPVRAAELRAEIAAGVAEIGDQAVTTKVDGYVAEAKDDVARLAEIANAVAMKLNAVREESKQAPSA